MYFCFLRDKFYVPEEILDMDLVHDRYIHYMYDENACRQCRYRYDRHGFMCDPCPSFLDLVQTYRPIIYKGKKYIGLPIGDKRRLKSVLTVDFDQIHIEDRRVCTRFDYRIKFEGQLRPYQEPLVADFLKHKYGLIQAPPRTGKTVCMLDIIIKLGKKALVLANQNEFLLQFEYHVRDYTNLAELEAKHGRKLFGIAKTEKDFDNYQICMSTYQRFLSPKGRELLRYIAPNFGSVAVDEVHRAAATCFLGVVSNLPSLYKFGCSATPDRKDKKEILIYQVMGPVTAETKIESMTPLVLVTDTGIGPKGGKGPKNWTNAMKWLANSDQRNKLIVDMVMRDLDNGHSIVIPSVLKQHIFLLTKMINKEWGSPIAEFFVGGGTKLNKDSRESTLNRAKSGKTRVVVGTRSLLQLGLNIPRWSCIYSVFPISNKPNLKQETSRIRTPMDGKPQPIIRFFVDNLDQSLYCFRSSFNHVKEFGYQFDPQNAPVIKQILGKISGRKGHVGDNIFEAYDDDVGYTYEGAKTFQGRKSVVKTGGRL